jgi:hypothetical protein
MVGGFFIAVCVALYAYEYGNLPETAISVKWLFATCAGHISHFHKQVMLMVAVSAPIRYCSFIVTFITVLSSEDDLGLVSCPIHGFLHIPGAGRRCRRSL